MGKGAYVHKTRESTPVSLKIVWFENQPIGGVIEERDEASAAISKYLTKEENGLP